MEGEERRRQKRYPVTIKARISLDESQEGDEVTVKDISRAGIKCITQKVYEMGQSIFVKIEVTTPEKEANKDSVKGLVAWIAKLETGEGYFLGIEFPELEQQNARLFEDIKILEDVLFPI